MRAEPNSPEEYSEMKPAYKDVLLTWITLAILPATKKSDDCSYFLKHEFERQTGLYVSNGEFKGAMLKAGYTPVDTSALNWTFHIKKANQRFKKQYALTDKGSPVFKYDISHISQNESATFADLVKIAKQREE